MVFLIKQFPFAMPVDMLRFSNDLSSCLHSFWISLCTLTEKMMRFDRHCSVIWWYEAIRFSSIKSPGKSKALEERHQVFVSHWKRWMLEKMSIYRSLVSSAPLAQVQMFLRRKTPNPCPKSNTPHSHTPPHRFQTPAQFSQFAQFSG